MDLLRWLEQRAWPLWLAHGIDRRRGGFHEFLTLDGLGCDAGYRRLRVLARQVYVFSEAHRRGLPGAAAAVEMGVDALRRQAALPGGGYAWRFDLDGRVTDGRVDLYDQAFVLLALSAATAVLPAGVLRPLALALDGFIDAAMAHPAGGYRESLPPALPRRQNPHMHLLEARLAAAESFGEPRFLEGADRLVALFRQRFCAPAAEPEALRLIEFFGETWDPVAPPVAEPGHHCEWVWLLHRHARLRGVAVPPEAEALRRFVDRHGAGPWGGLVDGVLPGGAVAAPGARLWPQTERLKADALRDPAAPDARAALAAYLRPDGLWHERRLPDGRLSQEAAPASSLYHLTCGILEAAA